MGLCCEGGRGRIAVSALESGADAVKTSAIGVFIIKSVRADIFVLLQGLWQAMDNS